MARRAGSATTVRYRCLAFLLVLTGCGPFAPAERADVIVTGGRVWTGDPLSPFAEAVAVQAARIVAVGSRSVVEDLVGPETRRIDASGGLVVPGFIDSHVHLLAAGHALSSVQLRDAATPDIFAQRIADHAEDLTAGTWIQGGQWDHSLWGGELPHRSWIDDLTPDHPVAVSRLDGHMLLANSVALVAAGIDRNTADVPGGEIVRDVDGQPTGLLKDSAMALVRSVIPRTPTALDDRALRSAMEYLASEGVTTVHDMADPVADPSGEGAWRKLGVYQRAQAAGALSVRIHACMPLASWERVADRLEASGRGDEWLRVDCLKDMVDGSLGSHTAAFHQDYSDAPGDRGLLIHEQDSETIYRHAVAADRAGLQLAIHAIGDRAIDAQLEVFERIAAGNGARDRRARIEHAQHPTASAIARFAELGVLASMQPYHAIDDGRWAESVIGSERAKSTYAFRSFLDAGATLAFGSDWDVAPASVIEGLHAAVTRQTLDGANPDGWIAAQTISVEEALHAYTVAGAYASFDEAEKGSIAVGKLADLVVLDRDLTSVPMEEIRSTRVLHTVVGGRVVFSRVGGGLAATDL